MKVLIKQLKQTGLLLCLLFAIHSGFSQSGSDLRINEVLVENDSNYVDDFGQRSAWIEIFNTAYNDVNMAGIYLTNDPTNPTKYWIPKGNPITVIPPRNYLVFFADNKTTRGILHLNFDLETSNYIAIYDANGHTLIDEIRFTNMNPDVSFGRLTDGSDEFGVLDKTTPKAANYTGAVVAAGEEFVKMDKYGFGMAFIAMSVVFAALMLLYLVFKNTRRLYTIDLKKMFTKEKILIDINEIHDISGEVNAAIAMALYLYHSELHDNEETVLTIKKVARNYSPWSSKIYGLNEPPR
ncbi:MAG: lamin tail domain-containing protein [Bacteroidales bacterium]|nr:lamin tail domain-containing protein [Bacteroidales bacterium]